MRRRSPDGTSTRTWTRRRRRGRWSRGSRPRPTAPSRDGRPARPRGHAGRARRLAASAMALARRIAGQVDRGGGTAPGRRTRRAVPARVDDAQRSSPTPRSATAGRCHRADRGRVGRRAAEASATARAARSPPASQMMRIAWARPEQRAGNRSRPRARRAQALRIGAQRDPRPRRRHAAQHRADDDDRADDGSRSSKKSSATGRGERTAAPRSRRGCRRAGGARRSGCRRPRRTRGSRWRPRRTG